MCVKLHQFSGILGFARSESVVSEAGINRVKVLFFKSFFLDFFEAKMKRIVVMPTIIDHNKFQGY